MKKTLAMFWTTTYHLLHGVDQLAQATDIGCSVVLKEAEVMLKETELEHTKRVSDLELALAG